jgi:hypothetical protein
MTQIAVSNKSAGQTLSVERILTILALRQVSPTPPQLEDTSRPHTIFTKTSRCGRTVNHEGFDRFSRKRGGIEPTNTTKQGRCDAAFEW